MLPYELKFEKIEAVFFDFDGVLVDSVSIKTKAYQEIFYPYGQKAVDLITNFHLANGGLDRYKKIEYVLAALGEGLEEKESLANRFASIVKDLVVMAEVIPGMLELLQKLNQKKIPSFIVSGTPEDELKSIVEKRSWLNFFQGVYGSPKSKVEIIGMILTDYKFDRKNCIFFGDATTDYNAALYHNLWYLGLPAQ